MEFWLVEFTILSQIEYPKCKGDPFSQCTQLSVKPASAELTSALNLSAFSCLTVRLLPDQDRSGLPRVRIAHNRELIHRSAGEKLRSRSVSLSAVAALLKRQPRKGESPIQVR
jgi:hypothetical protein